MREYLVAELRLALYQEDIRLYPGGFGETLIERIANIEGLLS